MYAFIIQESLAYLHNEYLFMAVNKQWRRIYKQLHDTSTSILAVNSASRLDWVKQSETTSAGFIYSCPIYRMFDLPGELKTIICNLRAGDLNKILSKHIHLALKEHNFGIIFRLQQTLSNHAKLLETFNTRCAYDAIAEEDPLSLKFAVAFPCLNKTDIFYRSILTDNREIIKCVLDANFGTIRDGMIFGALHSKIDAVEFMVDYRLDKNIETAMRVFICLMGIELAHLLFSY